MAPRFDAPDTFIGILTVLPEAPSESFTYIAIVPTSADTTGMHTNSMSNPSRAGSVIAFIALMLIAFIVLSLIL